MTLDTQESTTVAVLPLATRLSVTNEPMNPSPPVTRMWRPPLSVVLSDTRQTSVAIGHPARAERARTCDPSAR